jgi:hypothetical protein
MNLQSFKTSLTLPAPPADLPSALQALWWEAKGDWGKAHACAQAQDDAAGAWVHAYLHRQEGDANNAGYWYTRAGQPVAAVPLAVEWEAIAAALLQTRSP